MAENDLSSSKAEKEPLSSSWTFSKIKAPINCTECSKPFTRADNLRRHVEKFHPNKLSKVVALTTKSKSYKYKCSDCHRQYNHIRHLKFHERRMHMKQHVKSSRLYKCPLCYKEFEKSEINLHLEKEHELDLKTDTHTFSTYDEFSKWKLSVENDTKCFFAKVNTKNQSYSKYSKCSYFQCNRSGVYKPKGHGIRSLKASGSFKIDAFCPAMIKLYHSKDEYMAIFQSTHIGHENEFAHWKFIKGKFATGSLYEPVLYDVRSSMSTSSPQKLHMLTKQDVFNIGKSFDVSLNEVKHLNYPICVDNWIDEVALDETSCILLYKAQGTILADYIDLKADDFVLIMMNEAQTELFKQFGPECVCIDSTYGFKNLEYKLTQLIVLDNLQQCFPCAFMISNRIDEIIIKLFFSELKKVTGELKSKIFMSDVADFFYSAWCSVMGEIQTRLYSSWHVDHIWRKKLNRIKSKELRIETYRLLRTLLEERNIATFEDLLEKVILHLKDEEEIRQFGVFFIDNYSETGKYWAYSYRTHKDIDCDMYIEKMHKTLNCMYNKSKNVDSIEKIIHVIMKFLRDKLFDRVLNLSKWEMLQKLKIIKQKHEVSEDMEAVISKTEECEWLISPSQESNEIYIIKENNRECKCHLVCFYCNTCIHKYVCSCPDSAVKWNMCKHIHLLCAFMKRTIMNNEDNRDCSEDRNREIPFSDDTHSDELEEQSQNRLVICEEISDERKNSLKRKITSVMNSINSLSVEEFELVECIISSLPSKIRAIQMNS